MTFNYAEKIFSDCRVDFGSVHKRTLGLMDMDGYYTNAALLRSDQCEGVCPQHLPIIELLREAAEKLE